MKQKAKKTGSGILGSLTRKFGPLPAWLWITLLGVGIWYYRNKLGGSVSGTGTGSVAPTPATPQPQTVLQPGESVYDPNTGALTTAPGGDGSAAGTGNALDPNALATDIANAILANQQPTDTASPAPYYSTVPPDSGGSPPQTRTPPPLIGKGSVYAPFGHSKPTAPRGFRAFGLGSGFWEFRPITKRTVKPKSQHGSPSTGRTSRPTSGNSKSRSGASLRNKAAGRAAPKRPKTRTPANATGRHRGGVKQTATQKRVQSTKRTSPVIQHGPVRQRPVASHTPNRPAAQPSVHRTASTPTRTVRAPAPHPAPKKAAPKRKR